MSTTSGASPFRGGSTTTTSGRTPSAFSRAASAPASPHSNRVLSASPFRRAFPRASATAWGTTSTPMTRAACSARVRLMVPIPQYSSTTVSCPVRAAKSSARR